MTNPTHPCGRLALALLLLGLASVQAAKNPDKPDKPDRPSRVDKAERKAERAALAEVAAAAANPVVAAPLPAASSPRLERSSRSNGSGEARAFTPPTPADARYDNFRIIVERNIFNPTRIGRTRMGTEERAPRVDTIAFVGTMQSDKGTLAFFDSPDGTFRKVTREGQAVGEFKVQSIGTDTVELVRDGKAVSLKLAQQLTRPEGGDWSTGDMPRAEPSATTGATLGTPPPEPAAPPPIPTNASETLRRLMEQRQKQLKQ